MYTYQNKLVFIAHPRMASRSIADALERGGAGRWQKCHHQIDVDKIHEVQDADGIVACVQRNMFDVLVSWFYRSRTQTFVSGYEEKAPPVDEFDLWLRLAIEMGHQYLNPPIYHYGIEYSNYRIPMNLIDWIVPLMMRRAGMDMQELLHRGKSNRLMNYTAYYTPETRKLVEDRWEKDLSLTGYNFGD